MPVRASLSWTTPVTARLLVRDHVCDWTSWLTQLVLVQSDFERFVVDDAVHVA
jgi:hypothetical protein